MRRRVTPADAASATSSALRHPPAAAVPLPGNTPAQRKPSAAPMHGSAARGRSSVHSSVSEQQLISSAGSQQPQQEQQRTLAAVAGRPVAACLRRREAAGFSPSAGAQTAHPAHALCSPPARPAHQLLREPFGCLATARSPGPVAHQPTISQTDFWQVTRSQAEEED